MRILIATFVMFFATAAAMAQAQTSKFGIPSSNGSGAAVLPLSTVAQLPVCDVSHLGFMRAVTDATTPTYNGALVGGGAVLVAVVCTKTGWTSQ